MHQEPDRRLPGLAAPPRPGGEGLPGRPAEREERLPAEGRGERRRSPARTSGSSGSARAVAVLRARPEERPEAGPVGTEEHQRAAARRRAVVRAGMERAERRQPVRAAPAPRCAASRSRRSAPDQRAGAVRGEELEQHRVRGAAVEDHHRAHPAVDGVERGLRSSGSCRPRWCRRRSSRAPRRRELRSGPRRPASLTPATSVRSSSRSAFIAAAMAPAAVSPLTLKVSPFRPAPIGATTGMKSEPRKLAAGSRGASRPACRRSRGRPARRAAAEVLLADHQVRVLAGEADRLAALGVDRLDDALVDPPGQHHLDHLDGGGVADALAVDELGRGCRAASACR